MNQSLKTTCFYVLQSRTKKEHLDYDILVITLKTLVLSHLFSQLFFFDKDGKKIFYIESFLLFWFMNREYIKNS